MDIMSLVVDSSFILDIIFIFRTAIYDQDSGLEIRDAKLIACYYIKGRFTIDFLSTVPFDYIA